MSLKKSTTKYYSLTVLIFPAERLSSKNDQSVNSPEKIQRKAESPDDRQIEEEPNDEGELLHRV